MSGMSCKLGVELQSLFKKLSCESEGIGNGCSNANGARDFLLDISKIFYELSKYNLGKTKKETVINITDFLDKDQRNKFTKWNNKHKDCSKSKMDGRLEWRIIPTGFGNIIKCKCACGGIINLSESGLW